ncbi:MAG: dihydroorotate dehydrogenase [Desulfobacula sp.]|jgi:dihydroorotate dehydrogenase (NAD+) catalytic subunit|uniref:dihydroorotate dehydrogenase n=1 Tax=Desulfobacula sp. TaxID=2593537 RepID=UPI001E031A1C|nr:dihydroorotate dehydrogenase [Desulfobacula sp.]MBT3806617.1 dihydroorotate dehydrogenase [Desulfobacula sp.]MBT4025845.1 dihydroorotate dehydrogenase [Desulfobacula sp.]MBT4200619.1 dihydroorotate dehydrogenase [Desulfobacula sp.]MBT4507686.1 dihydroorotate dehydrogenase [Desulfobacula sp.]
MTIQFLGKTLKNPMVLASGVLGNSHDILERVHKNGCGLVTMKSIGPKPRDGHKNPTVIDLGCGMINAVGLPSPGYLNMENEWNDLEKRDFPIIASVYGGSVREYQMVAEFVSSKKPDFIEINISCPNSEKHGMIFGVNAQSSHDVVSAVKNVIKVPLIAKLSPQALDIGEIAMACEDAGADAICAINTLGPGMVIDIESKMPVLAFKKGGLSGPMIKPVAVRCVFDIYKAVKIPIIGLGGISNGKDAIEIIMAGASLVGIGSAVKYGGINVFQKVTDQMDTWLRDHDLSYEDIIGAAHRKG